MSASHPTDVAALAGARAGCVQTGTQQGVPRGAVGLSHFRRLLAEVWAAQAGPLASLALALGMGMKRDQAGDVLQDVYLAAIQKPPPIDDQTDLARWLFRVTANRCQLEHRRKGRWRRLWRGLVLAYRGQPAGRMGIPAEELRRDVDVALANLADDDRALVAMRYFSGLNSREIAEIVGVPESTVRGRLRAARQKLAQELAEHGDDE
ncbi:MAG: sigma-70 family RNA polymerase sigma factor [Planctomycetia bacterium]|nr:sigma-70 family RNA polymerase sigma factor [Planctomycetia bacterium]